MFFLHFLIFTPLEPFKKILLPLLMIISAVQASGPKLLLSPGRQTVGYTGRAVNFTWTFSGNQSLIDTIHFGTWNTINGYLENTLVFLSQSSDGNISSKTNKKKAVEEYRGRIRWAGDVSKGLAIFELSGIRHSDKRTYSIDMTYNDDDYTELSSQTKLIVQDPSNFTSTPPDSVSHGLGEQATFNWLYRLTDEDTKALSQIVFGVYRAEKYKPICVVQVQNKYVANTNCSTGVRQSTSHITVINPQSDATFVLSNIDLEDEAVYSIRLVGTHGNMQSKRRLVVTVPAKFVKKPKSTTTLEGSTLKLTCIVGGKPRPTIRWFKDNETVKTNSTEYLTMLEITREDSGQYHCVAENKVGRIVSEPKALVDVQFPPVINSSRKVNIIRVPIGTDMWLTCPTVANPPASVQWFANEILEKSDSEEFKVTVSSSFDYANYTCVAKNPFGQDNVTFDLRQVGPPLNPRVDCGKERHASLSCTFIFHWKSPNYNGGAPVFLYTVKNRSFVNALESNKRKWNSKNVTHKRFWYKFKLECLRPYEFTITAWNKYGESTIDTDNTCLITFGKGYGSVGGVATPIMPTQEIVADSFAIKLSAQREIVLLLLIRWSYISLFH